MDDRDFMDMMYQGFTKTTHAEDAYWGFEPEGHFWGSQGYDVEGDETGFCLFYVAQDDPEKKVFLGVLGNEADAAFLTAVHGSFPDIHRRWLEALDEADQKDLEKDLAEGVAANLSETLMHCEDAKGMVQGEWRVEHAKVQELEAKLAACERDYAKAEVTEDWHGRAAGA
jgi:hypothetical protein